MEVKEKSKKRELIKTIAIIFLVILLLLTFFSNTIMNRSLPEVATQMISGGTINAKIRGSGTVSANESYEVNLKQTRTIHSICVKVGDTVEQGDLLFVLEDGDSEELKAAQDALAAAQINYQKQLLNLSKQYESEDRTVAQLKKELEKAQEQVEANLVTDSDIAYAEGDLSMATDQLKQIQAAKDQIQALIDNNEQLNAAQKNLAALEEQITTLKGQITEYTNLLSSGLSEEQALKQAENAVNDAKRTLQSNWMAYATYYYNLISDVKTQYAGSGENEDKDRKDFIENIFKEVPDVSADFTITSDQQMYIDAYLAEFNSANSEKNPYEAPYKTLLSNYQDVQTKTATYDQLKMSSGSGGSSVTLIQGKLDQAQRELTAAEANLPFAQQAVSQAEASVTNFKAQLTSYNTAYEQQSAYVTELQENLDALKQKKTAYDTAVATVEQKELALEDALSGKDIDKQLNDLDLQTTRLELQKLQEQVDKLKTDTVSTEITAPVAGTISAINVSAGKEATPGVPMATIDVVDRGYTMKISVTNDQAKQIKVGDTANVTNYYWGSDLEAVVEAITADPSNPGKGKLVVFRITGDVDPGTNLTLSIGQRSAYSDTVVPKSALRSDANGDFVLVITEKKTPLGPRYIATRADVQILAQDDTSAAVSGLVSGDFVITTSSRPLSAGTQVRLVESQ